jgi:hypothetical protein
MRRDFDQLCAGKPVEHLARAIEPVDVRLVVDPLDVQKPTGEVGRGSHAAVNG